MHEVLTTAEMSEADRLAVAAGVPSLTLMENAGHAVADAAVAMVARGGRIAVLCGPGNNGGDGFVAARHLRDRGYDVRLHLLGAREHLTGDAAEVARRWPLPARPASPDALQSMHLVVDALFGAGLSRALDGAAAELVEAINASRLPVLAVDVPSGLDGTTAMAAGPVVQARRTVTFFRKKPAHLLMPGRALCGETIVADIGIPDRVLADVAPATFENGPALWASSYRWPRLASHKYTRGHAVVVSGPPFQSGAARLGAMAALRAGAGLVTLVGSPAACAVNATHMTSVMVRELDRGRALSEFLADTRRNAVLIGPGADPGDDTVADVKDVLGSAAAAVLDADALMSFEISSTASAEGGRMGFLVADTEAAHTPQDLFDAIRARAAPVVMTPHDGEFKRLFGVLPGSKLERTRAAAATSGAIVVLKGADTVIADPGGRATINANAPPWLATAGTGDVLAGIITGLLAQGMAGFDAACAGVWLHGAAASEHGIGVIGEDLPGLLPRVLWTSKLYAEIGR